MTRSVLLLFVITGALLTGCVPTLAEATTFAEETKIAFFTSEAETATVFAQETIDFGPIATLEQATEDALVSLGGWVWHDANGNGIQDDGEVGLANVHVELYDRFGSEVAQVTTDDEGNYRFDRIPAGRVSLVFVPARSDLAPSPMDVGEDDERDSDIFEEFKESVTEEFELAPGIDDFSRDAGFVTSGVSLFHCPLTEDQQAGEITSPEGYLIAWTVGQEEGIILHVCYVAVDPSGHPVSGAAFASFFNADDSADGSHAEEVFDSNGMAVIDLPIFYSSSEVVDLWVFFDPLAKALVIAQVMVE